MNPTCSQHKNNEMFFIYSDKDEKNTEESPQSPQSESNEISTQTMRSSTGNYKYKFKLRIRDRIEFGTLYHKLNS